MGVVGRGWCGRRGMVGREGAEGGGRWWAKGVVVGRGEGGEQKDQ